MIVQSQVHDDRLHYILSVSALLCFFYMHKNCVVAKMQRFTIVRNKVFLRSDKEMALKLSEQHLETV